MAVCEDQGSWIDGILTKYFFKKMIAIENRSNNNRQVEHNSNKSLTNIKFAATKIKQKARNYV